ncbi:MAG TPA: hypothetical protein VLU94_03110 [Candidatus Nitrosotalea sp.]|nr:hypothetical protein [Candidatus Nitrosotalea sp.]
MVAVQKVVEFQPSIFQSGSALKKHPEQLPAEMLRSEAAFRNTTALMFEPILLI